MLLPYFFDLVPEPNGARDHAKIGLSSGGLSNSTGLKVLEHYLVKSCSSGGLSNNTGVKGQFLTWMDFFSTPTGFFEAIIAAGRSKKQFMMLFKVKKGSAADYSGADRREQREQHNP